MGKKSDVEVLPKASAELLEAMKSGNDTIDATTLGSKAFAKLRDKSTSAMKTHLSTHNADQLALYNKVKSDTERRDFHAAFLLDCKSGGCVGKNYAERRTERKENTKKVNLTETQIAQLLNSEALAKIAITTCGKKLHDNKALADAKVYVYEWSISEEDFKK